MTFTSKAVLASACMAIAGFASLPSAGAQQSGSGAQPPSISPDRQTAIEAQMAQWQTVKQQTKKLTDNFLSEIGTNPEYTLSTYKSHIDSAWHVCNVREKNELARQQQLLAQLSSAPAGTVTPQSKAARTAAVNDIFELRMLYCYGTLIPKTLDESVQQGGHPVGRNLANGWKLALSRGEMEALYAQFKAASGFPANQVDPHP